MSLVEVARLGQRSNETQRKVEISTGREPVFWCGKRPAGQWKARREKMVQGKRDALTII